MPIGPHPVSSSAPASAPSFVLTLFPDLSGITSSPETFTLGSLEQRIIDTIVRKRADLPLLSGCRFGNVVSDHGSLRHNDNALALCAVIVEQDGGGQPIDLEVAKQLLATANFAFVGYTTPSHTPAAPRWRIVLPLSQEYPPGELVRFVEEMNHLLGGVVTVECRTLSQSWYFGRLANDTDFVSCRHHGVPLDLHPNLSRRPIGGAHSNPGKGRSVGSVGSSPAPPHHVAGTASVAAAAVQSPPPAHILSGFSLNDNGRANRPSPFGGLTPEQMNALLDVLLHLPEIIEIADRPRPEWLSVLFALADADHRGATEARDLALEWSMTSKRFKNEPDFDKAWNSFKPDRLNGISIGTLLKFAQDAGFDLGGWLAQLGSNGPTPPGGLGGGSSSGSNAGAATGATAGPGTTSSHTGTNAGGGNSTGATHAGQTNSSSAGATGWAPPQPLPSRSMPVPPFDPAWLPDSVRPFCMDIASSLPCPLDYVAVNLFTCLGTVLGNKLLVEAKVNSSWLEAPNIWGLVVGGVSQMKTPSARPFVQQLSRLQERAQQRHAAAMAQWQGASLAHQAYPKHLNKTLAAAAGRSGGAAPPAAPPVQVPPPEPQLQHYFSTDSSYEKLAELCLSNPAGVLVYGDELSGLLATLNREEMRKARAFYCEAYNGTASYKVDRIMRGTTVLSRFAIGVLGNIQPDPLCQLLMKSAEEGHQNDGLAQRFGLLVWPDPVPLAYVDQPRPGGATLSVCAIFDAFAELDPQKAGAKNHPGRWEWFIRLDNAAHARFLDWLNTENFPARQDPDLGAAMQAHLGKHPKLVLGLALILHLIDLVSTIIAPLQDPQGEIAKLTPVTLTAIERAIEIARYARQHAQRVYQAGIDPAYSTARLLAQRISTGALAGTVRARHIVQHNWSNLGDTNRVSAGLAVLEDFGWVRARLIQPGAKGGRPPSMEWSINPLGQGVAV